VREPIELSFGLVSGVGGGMDVLDKSSLASNGKGTFVGFSPHWFKWRNFNRNVFDFCVENG